MLGSLGSMMGGMPMNCCKPIRYVYLPNCPAWLDGRRFSSEREAMLIANVKTSDYPSEIKCDCVRGERAS